MVSIDEDETKADLIKKFPPQSMKIVTISTKVSVCQRIVERLNGDAVSSSCIELTPQNLDIFCDAAIGLVEVDQKDNSIIKRMKPTTSKMADLIVMDNALGNASSGKRWLSSTMANHLLSKGFKGIIAVLLSNKKESKKLLGSLSNIEQIHSFFLPEVSGSVPFFCFSVLSCFFLFDSVVVLELS